MPIYNNPKDPWFGIYCDVCQTEVLGLFRCDCGLNEHVYCEQHACSCATQEAIQ